MDSALYLDMHFEDIGTPVVICMSLFISVTYGF